MAEALLALGGNVGDVRTTLARAVDALCDGTNTRLVARSADYQTPPWGVTDQPPFVNVCIASDRAAALLARARRSNGVRPHRSGQRWGRVHSTSILSPLNIVLTHPDWPAVTAPGCFVLFPLAEINA
jgi:2-amino-4-hydroxy-6-hydroxymethyldihydropteridine diphosphokinase